LQHQDGSSHLLASTIPNCRAYDPCFAYELAVILEQGMRAMLQTQDDAFYYVTVMNEAYLHPSLPPGVEGGILNGMHRVRRGAAKKARVQLLGSGAILREALAAADILEQDWDVAADVWSVTSFTELRRDGLAAERWNRLHPTEAPRLSWVEECLNSTTGPVVAATDYVRALPDLIRTWVPRRYVTLGTDGFGRSDTRAALRRFFEVDRTAIAHAALAAMVEEGTLDPSRLAAFRKRCQYAPPVSAPWDA
jgi:pyruvate dehydrogenase E1 component